MNHQQLMTFCTVLNEGSMTAAASKLRLTQPAVSQQIRTLEAELQISLLVRGVRRVKPTMQGQLLYDYARRILNLTQQAEVALKTMSRSLSGNLRLGTLNSIGLYLLSPIVDLFLKHNQDIQVKLIYGDFHQIVKAMEAGEVDVTILPDIQSEIGKDISGFHSQFVMRDEMVLVGSSRDMSLPKTIDLKDFTLRPIIYYSQMRENFKKKLDEHLQEKQVTYTPIFEADNVGTLKRVIESGLGWGFMPQFSVEKQIQTRRLNHILVDEFSFGEDVNLYHRVGDSYEQMAEVFFRALQQRIHNRL